jgi:hypothetical protein
VRGPLGFAARLHGSKHVRDRPKASLTGTCQAPGILDSHRRYVIACTNFAGPKGIFKNHWPAGVSVLALDTTTDPLTATNVGGMAFPDSNGPLNEHLTADSIVQDAVSGDYYVGGSGGWCLQTPPCLLCQ